jgi:hypothetical protein
MKICPVITSIIHEGYVFRDRRQGELPSERLTLQFKHFCKVKTYTDSQTNAETNQEDKK